MKRVERKPSTQFFSDARFWVRRPRRRRPHGNRGAPRQPVALKRIGVLGYGATARAVLVALQENDATHSCGDATRSA